MYDISNISFFIYIPRISPIPVLCWLLLLPALPPPVRLSSSDPIPRSLSAYSFNKFTPCWVYCIAWSGVLHTCILLYCHTSGWSRFSVLRLDKADFKAPLLLVLLSLLSKSELKPFCIIFCIRYPRIAFLIEPDTDCCTLVSCENIQVKVSRIIKSFIRWGILFNNITWFDS